MFDMCEKWRDESKREEIIDSIFNEHIEKLTLPVFRDIYSFLELTNNDAELEE
jgi:hypothetical protein